MPHCPVCGREIKQQTVDQIVDAVFEYPTGTKIQVLSPIVRAKKGEHVKELEHAKKEGFVRARIDGECYTFVPVLPIQLKLQQRSLTET